MANSSKALTPRASDFSQWYQDVIDAADLAEHSDVKGAMVIKPYGYAIWERLQQILDAKIKETGHQNVYFPIFIPKSFFSKEAEHVEGFAKEMAVVTHHRLKKDPNGTGLVVDPEAKLTEELIVRPTSETAIHAGFARWIHSWRDLPVLINQWANVVRMELRPRMFLRTVEFLWQEGHTAHATEDDAENETKKMLEVYRTFAEEILAMAVISGQKTDSERFPGALRTYTIEAMMQDGKALQAGTSHNLGQGFAKAFTVQYLDHENNQQFVWMTSWGVSTRLVGGLIMTHSDDKGLVLPPNIAPYQVVIVPIVRDETQKESIAAAVHQLEEQLAAQSVRVHIDQREHLSLGEKLFDWEKKGVPVRVEIGPRDLAERNVTVVRRDTGAKKALGLSAFASYAPELLKDIQTNLLEAAKQRLAERTMVVTSYDDFKAKIEHGGFFRAAWCGDTPCEERLKDETKATIRCIPFEQLKTISDCLLCGKSGKHEVIMARAY